MCRLTEHQQGPVLWALVGVLVLAVWVLGSVPSATAETLKCRTAGHNRIQESVPVGDVEGHYVGVNVRIGMAFCDNGDVANFTVLASSDVTEGKGGEAQGYNLWSFPDGATMLAKFHQTMGPPSDERFAMDTPQATGEILSGTGRFAGIKGSLSFTGKGLKPIKGELGGRSAMDMTFTYTLPSK
jgi:hypothetical protein